MKLIKPVFFVGFMGAGKTTAARKIARHIGGMSVDADVYISRRVGMKTADYIAQYGIDEFRRIEKEAIHDLAGMENAFISLGGGAIETKENRETIKNCGYVVYFCISAYEASTRISNIATRPLFGDVESAEELNERRKPLYEEVADVTINVSGKTARDTMAILVEILQKQGILIADEKE